MQPRCSMCSWREKLLSTCLFVVLFFSFFHLNRYVSPVWNKADRHYITFVCDAKTRYANANMVFILFVCLYNNQRRFLVFFGSVCAILLVDWQPFFLNVQFSFARKKKLIQRKLGYEDNGSVFNKQTQKQNEHKNKTNTKTIHSRPKLFLQFEHSEMNHRVCVAVRHTAFGVRLRFPCERNRRSSKIVDTSEHTVAASTPAAHQFKKCIYLKNRKKNKETFFLTIYWYKVFKMVLFQCECVCVCLYAGLVPCVAYHRPHGHHLKHVRTRNHTRK